MEMAPKLSRARVSEQQCSMEIAQTLVITRFGATVLHGDPGPVPHSGPQGWQSLVQRALGVYSSHGLCWASSCGFLACLHSSLSGQQCRMEVKLSVCKTEVLKIVRDFP